MKTKFRKFTASLVTFAMLITQMLTLSVFADASYPDGTVTIEVDADGVPVDKEGEGWTYDEDSTMLILTGGGYYVVNGTCNVDVTNYGTIIDGTYNGTVNNTGNTETAGDIGGTIDNGVFNGAVNNYHGWNTCTINNGTFNGKVTLGNHGVINNGIFLGDFVTKLGYKINSATFKIEFETNGGAWAEGYTAPTTYDYSTSADIALPTADEISKADSLFYGWYSDENFSDEAVTQIPAKAIGKLTYYARYVDSNATWELVGEQAEENTDYMVDDDGNYCIKTAKGLAKFANIVNSGDELYGKTVALENDINLLDGGVTGYSAEGVNELNSWISIDGFMGTFNGNGKKIKNFYVSKGVLNKL